MFKWALLFFGLALLAALVGYVPRRSRATHAARTAFGICFVIGAVLFFIGLGVDWRLY